VVDGRAVLLIEQRVRLALEAATWALLREGSVALDAPAADVPSTPDLSSLFLSERAPHAS
jgi:ABC-type branched-subunit amino acid transport system ATPase component